VSGSIHVAILTRLAVIPPTRAPNIDAISPPMFCLFEEMANKMANKPSGNRALQ
jgi:hypothetical protein